MVVRKWGDPQFLRRSYAPASPTGLGLDIGHHHPPDVARAGIVERLSAAAMGHRRLSGALVRRLSGPQPLHRVRSLSALWRGFGLLAQSRHTGAGNPVDPATDVARVRDGQAVAASRREHRPGPDHGAALDRQHAADRHLCRACGAVAVSSWCCTATGSPASRNPCCSPSPPSPRQPTAPRSACCSGCAASAGSRGLGLRDRIAVSGLVQGSADHRQPGPPCCWRPISRCPDELAWTPGGTGVAFGRMLQDGIVARYLRDHCPQAKLSSAPIATNCRPPPTSSSGATACSTRSAASRGWTTRWDSSSPHALAEYPLWQAEAALAAPRSN